MPSSKILAYWCGSIPPKETNTINNPPEGFFACNAIHIWPTEWGFLPFHEFLSRFISHLGVAPIQLSPNVYTYLLSLELMALESGLPSLSFEVLSYLTRLVKLDTLNH